MIGESQNAATILAVDDDRTVLGLLDSVLKTAGYRVLTADCGRNAIQVFEQNEGTVNLLLTDVMMPDLTGPVVAERLLTKQPDLAVLFISGFHDADMVQRFVTAKGFSLLPKPFTVDALLRVVEMALNGR